MAAISLFGDTNMADVTSCEIQEYVLQAENLQLKGRTDPCTYLANLSRSPSLHTEPAPAVRAAVKTVLSCQSFALSPETVHFGCACRSTPSKGSD